MHCEIRSPERTLFEGDAKMVVAASPRGEFAIMADHAPLLATLANGAIRVQTEAEERTFACIGGTLRVADGRVTVLVESATPVEEIDLESVRKDLAQLPPVSDDDEVQLVSQREVLQTLESVKEKHG